MYKAMSRALPIILLLLHVSGVFSQTINQKLAKAYSAFMGDSQLRQAIASLYVIDARTNKVVFDRSSTIGMADASTQKIITAATAYEILGKEFRYETIFSTAGNIDSGVLNGSIYIRGSGDPTLGSWRWAQTKEEAVLGRVLNAFRSLRIKNFLSVIVDGRGWEGEVIPDGWIWQDLGNYYGAGSGVLNWRENQYDLILKPGVKQGDPVSILRTRPALYSYNLISNLVSGPVNSGDNAYIYFSTQGSTGFIRGSVPVQRDSFVISGAMPSARDQLIATLLDSLSSVGMHTKLSPLYLDSRRGQAPDAGRLKEFHREVSPPLDSMVFWFLRKSINLYGESLVKTLGFTKTQTATTDAGIVEIKKFWKSKGITETELRMYDGSGLSPQNRITTHAQVQVLAYARKQPWFTGFYLALPEYNAMKMKSGTIAGVKGFCGYHKSTTGQEYIFSFLVNNYNGSSSTLVTKMYDVLNLLK